MVFLSRSVLMVMFLYYGPCSAAEQNKTCSLNCLCFFDEGNDVWTARCDINQLQTVVKLPRHVSKLDLSNNSLTKIPTWIFPQVPHLTSLSLANNDIQRIEKNSFKDLPYLHILNLTNNDLHFWRVDNERELSNLRFAIVNKTPFLPSQQFLSLPMLTLIIGVTWTRACQDCALIRTEKIQNLTRDYGWEFCKLSADDFRFGNEVNYGLSIWYFKNGFSSQCLCENEQCNNEEIQTPYNTELNMVIRKLFYIEYPLGGIAVTANLVVVLTIILSRSLHKPSFIMICNLAFCDMLMGVYAVLIGRFTVYEFIVHNKEYPNMDVFVNHYCTAMGFIFTTSQMVATATSFLMTVERFLSIVYCMNPNRRLRRRLSIVLCIVFWCCGICYAVLAIARAGGLRYHGEYQCMLPFVYSDNIHDVSTSTLVIAILVVVTYILSICLYIPIYRYVKNTRFSVGIKRKAILAKNIAIMISTNCVFFLLPLISTIVFVYFYSKFMEFLKVDTMRELQTYFIFLSWLPVVLLCINSCLNPFLCAFRHPLFQEQLKAALVKMKILNRRSRPRERHQHKPQSSVILDYLNSKNREPNLGITNQTVEEATAFS